MHVYQYDNFSVLSVVMQCTRMTHTHTPSHCQKASADMQLPGLSKANGAKTMTVWSN